MRGPGVPDDAGGGLAVTRTRRRRGAVVGPPDDAGACKKQEMITSEGPAAGFCRSTAYRMSNLTVDLVELTLILMIPVCQPNSDLAYDGNLADGQDRWWNIKIKLNSKGRWDAL